MRKLKYKKENNLKPKTQNLKAFTIVELLVAMGLFVVLIGISTGGFIKALQTQKAIISLMEANDNASLALEQMAREIRTGYNFSKISETEIQFVNQRNQVVWYRLNEETIERGTEKEGVVSQRIYKKITADNVKIMNFKVALFGSNVGDGYPPRITISLSVGPTGRYLENVLTNIQTTISARTLDS
ncbi:MAG: type II secretion system protein [bacterium]|nr:type II secretion system protein [bacterium]